MGEVTVHSAFEEVADEWDELAARTRATPFARPLWLTTFWRHFGRGKLELVALRRGGALVALAPLARRGGVLEAPANFHTPESGFVAEDDEAVSELAAAVFDRCRRLDMRYVDRDSPTAEAVRSEAGRRGWLVFETVALRSPYVVVEGTYDDYLEQRTPQRRKDIRRNRRRLGEEIGPITAEVHASEDGLGDVLRDAFRLEESGWKAADGTAITSSPITKSFYEEICAANAQAGAVRVFFLLCGGRRLATDIGFEADGHHFSLKMGYDPEFRSRGVGVILQEEVLRHDWEAGVRVYEFLGDAEPHKLEWTSTVRKRVHLRCFSRHPRSLAEFGAWRYGREAGKRIRALSRR